MVWNRVRVPESQRWQGNMEKERVKITFAFRSKKLSILQTLHMTSWPTWRPVDQNWSGFAKKICKNHKNLDQTISQTKGKSTFKNSVHLTYCSVYPGLVKIYLTFAVRFKFLQQTCLSFANRKNMTMRFTFIDSLWAFVVPLCAAFMKIEIFSSL